MRVGPPSMKMNRRGSHGTDVTEGHGLIFEIHLAYVKIKIKIKMKLISITSSSKISTVRIAAYRARPHVGCALRPRVLGLVRPALDGEDIDGGIEELGASAIIGATAVSLLFDPGSGAFSEVGSAGSEAVFTSCLKRDERVLIRMA